MRTVFLATRGDGILLRVLRVVTIAARPSRLQENRRLLMAAVGLGKAGLTLAAPATRSVVTMTSVGPRILVQATRIVLVLSLAGRFVNPRFLGPR
jgi:hypothetical protein